jgi:hypothetical protein
MYSSYWVKMPAILAKSFFRCQPSAQKRKISRSLNSENLQIDRQPREFGGGINLQFGFYLTRIDQKIT